MSLLWQTLRVAYWDVPVKSVLKSNQHYWCNEQKGLHYHMEWHLNIPVSMSVKERSSVPREGVLEGRVTLSATRNRDNQLASRSVLNNLNYLSRQFIPKRSVWTLATAGIPWLVMERVAPAVKGTLWTRFRLGLKFVYLISLTKEYIMDSYGNRTISYQTYIIA